MESFNNPEPPHLHPGHRREHGEPVDHRIPMSMTVLVFICGLFFTAGIYIALYNGNFDAFTFDENQRGTAAVEAPEPPEPLATLGEKIFKRNCTQCHQSDGLGVPEAYPPLKGSPWVTGSADRMTRVVLNGMSGPVEVLGKPFNGNMPAWSGTLKDRQIAAVITYLRSRADWNHAASEVTVEQITALRASIGTHAPWSPAELINLYPQ